MDGNESHHIDFIRKFDASGSNQSGMRERNERLVLTILRRKGPLPKAEIARITGLSAQTVSVIMRALERDGLLERGEKLRGKIGQPSIPMRLAPNGAYFLGLKVGRRSAELTLVNFVGEELAHLSKPYSFPTPDMTLDFARSGVEELCAHLAPSERQRIAGLGIASPFFLWEWASVIGVHPEDMAAWKDFDIQAEMAKMFDFPVFLGNDATSACGAELTFGTTDTPPDFLYIYIGYFVGGGVVLNGTLYSGRSGNAGAIGPYPVVSKDGRQTQLVDTASLIGLERRVLAKQRQSEPAASEVNVWDLCDPKTFDDWMDEAVPTLAQLIIGSCSVIDFPSVLIDGNMPEPRREKVIVRITQALDALPLSGLIKPDVAPGSLHTRARRLGAASLPLSKKFMLEA
ncbi:MAG: ROK family transcriptional regulator [Pseudomonadota bacterium]